MAEPHELPLRITSDPAARVISVDGVWGAPGLHLSHWPGNATPRELRHELSTGSALAFSRLPLERRRALAAGCTAVANNHLDTDGICALFAVLHPAAALPRAERLLAAARAGDFFAPQDEAAFLTDAVITARIEAAGDDGDERFVRHLCELLPALLDGEFAAHESSWRAPLAAWHEDRRLLAAARHDELSHLELAVFTAAEDEASDRGFDVGRHALWSLTPCDRVLVLGPTRAGTTARLLVGTRSWFDIDSAGPLGRELARPDLTRLAQRLNELEGTASAAAAPAWRHQDPRGASPELWFGLPQPRSFPERADVLAASRLDAETIRGEIIEELRLRSSFPDEVAAGDFLEY